MNRKKSTLQIILFFLVFISITPIVKSTITQEWLFWPSDSNGKLKVNSADNISKITNSNKAETLNLRYSITDELTKFNDAQLDPFISSIDLTYFSPELLKQEELSKDKDFIPLFGNYETGLHISLTTKEGTYDIEKVTQLMDDTCQFINKLFAYSGYTLCKKGDLVLFNDLKKMGPISPKHYYMFVANFNFEKIEGYSLYHIFGLAQKQELELGCEFDDEAIDDWTSKYFNIVISRQPNMLDEKDIQKDEEDNTLIMKFEEILHFKFPESSKCKVNLHLNEVSVIDDMKKTENNGYTIKNINPRGKKNDELVYIPCPIPKINFSYKLSPGVGLHPVLFVTIETHEWIENQPLSMILTLDPNIFADEYQINSKIYEKGVKLTVYCHPNLEVAVTDKQAKFNFVKVVIDHMTPHSKKTIEIPLHLRYPESYQEPSGDKQNSDDNNIKSSVKDNEMNSENKDENDENKNEKYDNRHFKQVIINPPRFYTTSNKLCNQKSFSSISHPILILTSIEKDRNRALSIIPVKSISSKSSDENSSSSSIPIKIDVPRGQLSHYSIISFLTLVATLSGIIIIIYAMTLYSKFNPSKGLENVQEQKQMKNTTTTSPKKQKSNQQKDTRKQK